jgi:UDP-N-acetylglucosamine--N-acetylmuramyl-(pentapeptide) pyrophosphoryl-undecaprenol N-acetylglucosamine transferase
VTSPIVLTGGGTGGHVFPIRAIADALLAQGVAPSGLKIVGSRRGQDRELLADLAEVGVEIVLLPGRGLRRSLSPEAVLQNTVASLGLAWALLQGVRLARRWRPAAVVSVGGYAAFAASAGAVLAARPLVLVNFDASPGLVNRVLSTFAVAIASALPEEGVARAVVTGAPIRESIAAVSREPSARMAARARLGVANDVTVVAVMTGSLGAASVNTAVCELAARWRDDPDVTLYHVTGRRDAAAVEATRAASGIGPANWRTVPFESDMADLWSACDLAVCRAGALTIAELCATGVPSVLVPLPGAPGSHQEKNADVLARAGAAVVIADDLMSGERLDHTISGLLADPGALARMSAAARGLSRPDAARRVATVVLDSAR